MRVTVFALALVVFSGGMGLDGKAFSQSCGPLKEVASLAMTVLPDGSRVSVPLTIDGTPVSLLIDTGAGMSSLTQPAATMLGIRQRDSEKMRLVNADGAAIHHYYLADNFQLGRLTAKNVPFMQSVDIDNAGVSGAIGPDLMLRYDVDMDFSEQRLTYFSQDHCRGHIVHWQADAVTQIPISLVSRAKDYPPPLLPGAVGSLSPDFVAMAMALANGAPILGTDIRAKVMLDGRVFIANIDTGLDISTINSKAAQDYFDVPLDDPRPDKPETHRDQSTQPSPGTEKITVTARRQEHQFRSLTFGGVTVTNALFVLKPGPMGVHRAGDPEPPDITIGMNVLRKLHLYFAFGERMLYVSAAGAVRTRTDEDKVEAP
jgi:Aspartyl protease